jgi:hypothetical protein
LIYLTRVLQFKHLFFLNKNSNSDKKGAPRRKKVLGVFFQKINSKEEEAREACIHNPHHHSLVIFFRPIIDHDDHQHPLFRRLYLGRQPRYEPSAASSLSPTPVATKGCPPIIRLHRGLLLRKLISVESTAIP